MYLYLPHPVMELPKTPKYWIANVCATVIGDPFVKWISNQINVRNGRIVDKKGLGVSMCKDIARAFK